MSERNGGGKIECLCWMVTKRGGKMIKKPPEAPYKP